MRPTDPEKIDRHDRSGGTRSGETLRARRAREDRGESRGRKAPGDDDAEIPDHVMQDFEESWGERRRGDVVIGTITRETEGATEWSRCRPPGAAYWLITKTANGRVEVLTLDCGTGETLPVFSHAEEAEMFLRLRQAGDEWRVTESRAGGLISVLYGPCACVKEVALDPLPEMVARGTVGLVTLARDRFMDHLANARRRPRLEGDPPVPVRYSFCEGPDGEQIELFQGDVL